MGAYKYIKVQLLPAGVKEPAALFLRKALEDYEDNLLLEGIYHDKDKGHGYIIEKYA